MSRVSRLAIAFTLVAAGLSLVTIGAVLEGYAQAVALQLGGAILILPAVVVLERLLEARVRVRVEDSVAQSVSEVLNAEPLDEYLKMARAAIEDAARTSHWTVSWTDSTPTTLRAVIGAPDRAVSVFISSLPVPVSAVAAKEAAVTSNGRALVLVSPRGITRAAAAAVPDLRIVRGTGREPFAQLGRALAELLEPST